MLAKPLDPNARYLRLTFLATLSIAFALGSPQALARGDTEKSLAACKAKIATLIDGRHRVKLDKVRRSRLRLKVLFPGAPREILWCDNRSGEVLLSTASGAPYAGRTQKDDRVAVMANQAEDQL